MAAVDETVSSPERAKPLKTRAALTKLMENAQGTPLDYSFMELATLEEALEEEPFAGQRKPRVVEEAETEAQGAEAQSPPVEKEEEEKQKQEQGTKKKPVLKTNALRLSNNLLDDLRGFNKLVREVLWEPENLAWVDLSHNKLTEVPQALAKYEKLNVVYLHANQIQKVKEVEKLATLPLMRSLTLHGNPMESTKNYRLLIISTLPTLKSLDFSSITLLDRDRAKMLKVTTERRKLERERRD